MATLEFCPHCGRELHTNSTGVHVAACAKLPPDDELVALYQSGISTMDLAKRFGVGDAIVCDRLRPHGVFTAWRAVDRLETLDQYALPAKPGGMRCETCKLLRYCNIFKMPPIAWTFCEKPDERQLYWFAQHGITEEHLFHWSNEARLVIWEGEDE